MLCKYKKSNSTYFLLFSLTAHYISEARAPERWLLCVKPIPVQHTGENVSQQLDLMLEEWNIPKDKIHLIMRDQGANMIKVRLFTFIHILGLSNT